MNRKIKCLWAAMALAIVMIVKINPAMAQYTRPQAGTAQTGCDASHPNVTAILCQQPGFAATCSLCINVQVNCTVNCGPAAAPASTGPAATPPATVRNVYHSHADCGEGGKMVLDANRRETCECREGSVAVVRMNTRVTSDQTTKDVRSINVTTWYQCVPTEKTVDTIIADLKAFKVAFVSYIQLQAVRDADQDAKIADLTAKVDKALKEAEEAKRLGVTALQRIDALNAWLRLIPAAFAELQNDIERVREGATKLSVGLGVGALSRGDAGTLIHGLGVVGFHATVPGTRLILWADAQFGYGSSDGVKIDGSSGPLWTAGGASGLGTTFDPKGYVQGRIGFRATQVFVTGGNGEHFRGFNLAGVGQVRFDIPDSPVFISGEFGLGGGRASYFGGEKPISRAHNDSPIQFGGGVILGLTTNIF
ncbi:MAG: hypothetical protein ACYC44_01190 [Patescibacteria group bacterium]